MKARVPLSLVIPVRDEAAALPALLAGLRRAGLPRRTEILVVDDGSTDGSGALARGLGAKTLRLEALGYGAALKAGFKAARGEWLGMMDADGTYSPQSMARLWRRRAGADMLLLDRMREGKGMPWERSLGNRAFNILASLLAAKKIPDLCSGQRLLRRDQAVLAEGLPDGLDFSPAFTLAALKAGRRLEWIPGPYAERSGSSKLRLISDGLRFLAAILRRA